MKKLIFVDHGGWKPNVNLDGFRNQQYDMQALEGKSFGPDRGINYTKEASYFLVDHRDVEGAVKALAEANPGCDVSVYNLEAVAVCPAAPLVTKKVTEAGILPA